MDYVVLSKEVSYALRHAPWEYELELDDEGFVPVGQLLDALNGRESFDRKVTEEDLARMIAASEKRRHEIVDNRIRALYGHTVPGRLSKEGAIPPDVLYHGTTHKAAAKIIEDGLKPMGRQYVHLSTDAETATCVGRRRDSNPVLHAIDSLAASKAGIIFYVGNEKVWLADFVPPRFLSVI